MSSSLLARFAENIFWIGRYVERAESMARLLHTTETYARNAPEGSEWQRILDLYKDDLRFAETHGEANAQSVANYYVLDRGNSSSIVSSIGYARENARSVRHLLSTEMWTQVNIFHSEMRELVSRDIHSPDLSGTLKNIIIKCQAFEGIAEGTFLRSEPWCFYEMGKYIERGDQTTRTLDMGYDRLQVSEADPVASVHWNVLLRSLAGYHAYRSCHPAGSSPADIATFLLHNTEFPRSVGRCIGRVSARIGDIDRIHQGNSSAALEKVRRHLEFSLGTGPGGDFTSDSLHKFLDQLQKELGSLSNAIANAYFIYGT